MVKIETTSGENRTSTCADWLPTLTSARVLIPTRTILSVVWPDAFPATTPERASTTATEGSETAIRQDSVTSDHFPDSSRADTTKRCDADGLERAIRAGVKRTSCQVCPQAMRLMKAKNSGMVTALAIRRSGKSVDGGSGRH